jgi:hypothetical protein
MPPPRAIAGPTSSRGISPGRNCGETPYTWSCSPAAGCRSRDGSRTWGAGAVCCWRSWPRRAAARRGADGRPNGLRPRATWSWWGSTPRSGRSERRAARWVPRPRWPAPTSAPRLRPQQRDRAPRRPALPGSRRAGPAAALGRRGARARWGAAGPRGGRSRGSRVPRRAFGRADLLGRPRSPFARFAYRSAAGWVDAVARLGLEARAVPMRSGTPFANVLIAGRRPGR